jgi:hypothetical protein
MAQLRKPSSMVQYTPLQIASASIESRIRPLFTRRGIVYSCSTLFILLLFSVTLIGLPDGGAMMASSWTSRGDETPLWITPVSPLNHIRPPNIHNSFLPHPPPQSLNGLDEQERIPLISTNNNGTVVMLTGATGPGHFARVPDFFSKVVNNRLDYANAHGSQSLK